MEVFVRQSGNSAGTKDAVRGGRKDVVGCCIIAICIACRLHPPTLPAKRPSLPQPVMAGTASTQRHDKANALVCCPAVLLCAIWQALPLPPGGECNMHMHMHMREAIDIVASALCA